MKVYSTTLRSTTEITPDMSQTDNKMERIVKGQTDRQTNRLIFQTHKKHWEEIFWKMVSDVKANCLYYNTTNKYIHIINTRLKTFNLG